MSVVQASIERVCSICGEPISSRARKCSKCDSYQGECNACGMPIPSGARRCFDCKAFQDGRPCRSCGLAMPVSAKRCPECKAFQDWRAAVPGGEVVLALILSLVSVISAVAPAAYTAWNNRSDTYVRFIAESTMENKNDPIPVLTVLVVNNGGRPALVRRASLTGNGLPIDANELRILNATDKLVLPAKTAMLRLTTTQLKARKRRNDLLAMLNQGSVTITVDVEETGRLGGRKIRSHSDEAKGADIEELVKKRVE
jgi:hypothetical protein